MVLRDTLSSSARARVDGSFTLLLALPREWMIAGLRTLAGRGEFDERAETSVIKNWHRFSLENDPVDWYSIWAAEAAQMEHQNNFL